MTTIKDRTYYRMLTDEQLVQRVRYPDDENWEELAFVLAERLREVR